MANAPFESYPLGDNLRMAQLVMEGLPTVAIKGVGAVLGLRAAGVGELVNIPRKTMERRLKARSIACPACATQRGEKPWTAPVSRR